MQLGSMRKPELIVPGMALAQGLFDVRWRRDVAEPGATKPSHRIDLGIVAADANACAVFNATRRFPSRRASRK
jgi:hypothetical protein